MRKELLDAVKAATSIHKGDFSILRGKSFLICDNIENNKKRSKHVKRSKLKYTLNQIGDMVSSVSTQVKKMDARLDYIVQANNLKDNK